MVTKRRAYADTGHGQMHYREVRPTGNAIGNVVLLHQVSSSSAMYDAVMPVLAERGYRCIAPDSPGFGATDSLGDGATIHDYGDFFQEFIESLGLDCFTLVGHHNGARQSIMLGARGLKGLERIIVVNVPYHPDKSLRSARFEEKRIKDPVPQEDASHILHEWNRLKDLAIESLPPGATGLTPEHHTRELVDTLRAWNYAAMYRISFSHDIEQAIRDVQVPLLFIACDGDWLGKNQPAAAAIAPQGAVVDMAGGVFVFDQRPQAIGDVIATYLETGSTASTQQAANRWPWGSVDGDAIR